MRPMRCQDLRGFWDPSQPKSHQTVGKTEAVWGGPYGSHSAGQVCKTPGEGKPTFLLYCHALEEGRVPVDGQFQRNLVPRARQRPSPWAGPGGGHRPAVRRGTSTQPPTAGELAPPPLRCSEGPGSSQPSGQWCFRWSQARLPRQALNAEHPDERPVGRAESP